MRERVTASDVVSVPGIYCIRVSLMPGESRASLMMSVCCNAKTLVSKDRFFLLFFLLNNQVPGKTGGFD